MDQSLPQPSQKPLWQTGALAVSIVATWFAAYNLILPLANWITYSLFQIPGSSHLGESVAFFLYDVPKILLLLSGMIFLISIIRTFFSPERTRALLGGKRAGDRQRVGCHAGYRHSVLLLFGRAAVYRFCRERHSTGSHLFFPDCRADHQRSGGGDAVRAVWLEGGRVVHRLRADYRHYGRNGHRPAETGTLRGRFRLADAGSRWC